VYAFAVPRLGYRTHFIFARKKQKNFDSIAALALSPAVPGDPWLCGSCEDATFSRPLGVAQAPGASAKKPKSLSDVGWLVKLHQRLGARGDLKFDCSQWLRVTARFCRIRRQS
jgi:hypothetical protein